MTFLLMIKIFYLLLVKAGWYSPRYVVNREKKAFSSEKALKRSTHFGQLKTHAMIFFPEWEVCLFSNTPYRSLTMECFLMKMRSLGRKTRKSNIVVNSFYGFNKYLSRRIRRA